MINDKPGVALREVARATGLSAATVQDVRQRISRGEDPVPGRYRVTGDQETMPGAAAPRGSRTRRKDIPADRQALLAMLRDDPSLRLTEAGRHTLRWLHHHTVDTDGLDSLGGRLPDGWAPIVADLARSCATAWTKLAEQLERRTE
jgi:hypothetical protein